MLALLKKQWERLVVGARKNPRKLAFIPVYYQLPDAPWTLSQALNVSETGACILISSSLNVGDEFQLELPNKNLSKSEVLSVKAGVVWIKESTYAARQYECGLVFIEKQVKYRREKNIVYSLADINCSFLEQHARNCTGKIVNNLDDLKDAYEVLYNEYSSRNLCAPNEARLYYNFYSLTPGARTFVLKRGKDLLGTMSIILDSPCGLPMEATYPEELKEFRSQGKQLAEIGLLALNSRFFSTSRYSLKNIEKQAHLFKLFKTMFDYVRAMTNCTDLIMGCHPKHAALYKYLNFEQVGEVRDHKEVRSAPAVLMKFDVINVIRNNTLLNEGPGMYFLKPCDSPDLLHQHFPWTAQTIHKFLHHFRPLWDQLSEKQKEYINKAYPNV